MTLVFGYTFKDGVNAFEKKDYTLAIKIFEDLDSKGNLKASYNLGHMYENGLGVKKDFNKAIEYYEKASKKGLKEAQEFMALYYEKNKDFQKAIDLFDSACNSGLEYSCKEYSKLRKNGYESTFKKEFEDGVSYYNNKDFKSAFSIFEKLANQNYSKSYFYLAQMYQNAQGVEQNYSKALEIYGKAFNVDKEKSIDNITTIYHELKKSNQLDSLSNENKIILYQALAERGDVEFQFKLASIYSDGETLNQDFELAKEWYNKACENRDEVACFRARVINETGSLFNGKQLSINNGKAALEAKDYEMAIKIFIELALMKSNGEAQLQLAEMYDKKLGIDLNSKDAYIEADKKAFEWLEKAANNPNDYFRKFFAEYSLGLMYYHGKSVDINYNKAIELYKKSSNNEYSKLAPFELGNIYKDGIVVKQDDAEALKWYELAAERKNEAAKLIVADMYYDGIGTKKDHQKARAIYEDIVKKDDIPMLKRIANIYEVEKNYNGALIYYQMAYSAGDIESGKKYDEISKKVRNAGDALERTNKRFN